MLACQMFACVLIFACAPACVCVCAGMHVSVHMCACQMWDLSDALRCVCRLPSIIALNIYACFPNVHCGHQTLRIEYAGCIFRAVIISRPSAFFFLLVKQSDYVSFTNYSPDLGRLQTISSLQQSMRRHFVVSLLD